MDRYPLVGTGDAAKNGVGIDSFGALVTHSDDGGKTWAEPTPLDDLRASACAVTASDSPGANCSCRVIIT